MFILAFIYIKEHKTDALQLNDIIRGRGKILFTHMEWREGGKKKGRKEEGKKRRRERKEEEKGGKKRVRSPVCIMISIYNKKDSIVWGGES